MEEVHRATHGERALELPGSPGVPLPPNMHVFTNLEALWTPSFRIFKEASLQRHSRLSRWLLVIELYPQPSPLPSPVVRKWGSSNLWSHGWSSGQPAPPSLLLTPLGGMNPDYWEPISTKVNQADQNKALKIKLHYNHKRIKVDQVLNLNKPKIKYLNRNPNLLT